MPKKIHDKVDDLLSSDSFYPEKSEKEREELAWPIATNIVKESSFNLKNYRIAQDNQDLFKSNSIDEFVEKFKKYTDANPSLLTKMAFGQYILRNATYLGKKLSGYPAFSKLLSFLNSQNRIVPSEEIKKYLDDRNTESSDNFKFDENANKETEIATSEPAVMDSRQGITGDTVANNFPGQEKATGNYGTPGIQGITQFTSQSAANAPKTKEQIDASERMFMMDNMNALRILSRNIYDVNALRNFEKDLTLSKNHIGTRFQGPVNNLLGKYGELASTPDSDRKTKNKLGAEIQYIIQNQLLGSGVRPSVIFNSLQNPNSRTDYLFSGKRPPTPYQFRYVEDVYFDMKNELTTKFNEDRKTFAEDYVKKLKERFPDAQETPETLGEAVYPDELKLVAKPGSPIHQRAWMEKNQKSVLQQAFGAEQAANDSSSPSDANPKGTMTFNSSNRNPGSQLNAPEAPDPRNFDKSNLIGILGRPSVTNPNPTNPNPTNTSPFNLKNSTPPATPPAKS